MKTTSRKVNDILRLVCSPFVFWSAQVCVGTEQREKKAASLSLCREANSIFSDERRRNKIKRSAAAAAQGRAPKRER